MIEFRRTTAAKRRPARAYAVTEQMAADMIDLASLDESCTVADLERLGYSDAEIAFHGRRARLAIAAAEVYRVGAEL